MPISLITGPANAGKAEFLLGAVRRHLARGEEPLLIVPTRADVEHYARELAGERAAMGVRIERFGGLTEETVARAGLGEVALGGVAREALLRALADGRGAPAAPGFVRALAELFSELQVRRVSPARLARAIAGLVAADGANDPLEELGRLFARYRSTLERLGRVDPEERSVRALDELRRRPSLWGGTPVLVYGFDDLTALQLDTIETLGAVVDAPVTVSLAYEPGRAAFAGRAASFHALAPRGREHRELPARSEHYAARSRLALSHLERSLFETGAGRVEPGEAVRLLEGGGERAELELIAREAAALLEGGHAPEEIAVVVRPGGTDLDLLEEVFGHARLPFAVQRRRPFADAPVGRGLIGLLRCVPSPAAPGAGEVGDLLAWLRAPGVLRRPALADSLEASARRSGALDAARARALWEERHWPLDAIDRLEQAQGRGPVALLDLAARELQRLFSSPRRRAACVLDQDELGDAAALAAGRSALAELRELARTAPELAPPTAGELARALERLEPLSGSAPAPGAIAVLDPLALRARRVRALFVCGLQEGVFPARARPRPLLAEEERRRLAEVSGLVLGESQDVLAAERYLLYAALSRPQEQLFLSWHLADDDGQPTSRSLFVDDVCDLFSPALVQRTLRRALGAVEPQPAAADTAAGRPRAPADEPLRDGRVLAELRERVWSASSLETWIGCPVKWFVERLLDPSRLEPDPEPLARGGLAHAALKDTLEGLRRETGSARVTPASLGRALELLATALADNEPGHPLSVAPERRTAVRRRLIAELERYLRHAAETDSLLEPSALELGFGFDADDERGDGSSLPAVGLDGGVRLRGRIDRVDVGSDGSAVVYDYKGARAPRSASWIRDGDVQVALYMRAVEELLGLRVRGGFYQPLSGEDLRARGVLDGDAVELGGMAQDEREPSELRALVDEAVALAVRAAAEAGRGALEPRPQTCAFRGGCMYPTICRCER